MFLLNFQVEVIIDMFIKREPTPYKAKAKNFPKNTQNDNAISHIPVIHRTHIPYP
jgi:hypothetical protein